jgi:hypothetical protein
MPDKPNAPDPRLESISWAPPKEIQTALNAALERTRALISVPLPPGVNVDWSATEHSVRLGVLIEHLLGDMETPARLLYELHVVRQIGAFAAEIPQQAREAADERARQAARATLMQGLNAGVPNGQRRP